MTLAQLKELKKVTLRHVAWKKETLSICALLQFTLGHLGFEVPASAFVVIWIVS